MTSEGHFTSKSLERHFLKGDVSCKTKYSVYATEIFYPSDQLTRSRVAQPPLASIHVPSSGNICLKIHTVGSLPGTA